MVPTNREEFKTWCLRKLGHPVIQINVDDDQVDDRVDEAFQYWQDFHHDGVDRIYLKHQITADDFNNKYVPIPDEVIGVIRIFPWSAASTVSANMFDLRYQMRLHELYDFTSTSYTHYVITMQHLRTLDMLFNGEQPIRFNRHGSKLYIDWNWSGSKVGDWIVIESFRILNPDDNVKVYNDRMLKDLATALIKLQWGNNMKKFGTMQLPGGVNLSGQQIFDEATAEVEKIQNLIRDTYEVPPMMMIG